MPLAGRSSPATRPIDPGVASAFKRVRTRAILPAAGARPMQRMHCCSAALTPTLVAGSAYILNCEKSRRKSQEAPALEGERHQDWRNDKELIHEHAALYRKRLCRWQERGRARRRPPWALAARL